MQKLSVRKQSSIIKLYLGGFSYDDIAARIGVSKGSVANVVADLRAGRILEAQEPVEQLELLRELAVDLRRLKLTPGQAVTGLAIFSRLQELGVEPADIEPWAAICHQLTQEETEVQAFVRAALYMEQVRQRTGLNFEDLEEKVHRLEDEVSRLEPLVKELEACREQLEELKKRRQSLADEMSQLEKRHQLLSRNVSQKERREAELSHRVQELEQRAQDADERLAAARRHLQELASLGLSPDEIPGFAQRLSVVAQRHGIESDRLRERLLHELEVLEECLGLEAVVEVKQDELAEANRAVVEAQEELAALKAATQRLRQEQAALHAAITEEQKYVRKEIGAIARIAKDAVAELRQDLGDGVGQAVLEVQELKTQALELGKELGQAEGIIESNQWLQTLLALIKGDDDLSASRVRALGLGVLRGILSWLNQHWNENASFSVLRLKVYAFVEELEQWKV